MSTPFDALLLLNPVGVPESIVFDAFFLFTGRFPEENLEEEKITVLLWNIVCIAFLQLFCYN